MHVLSRSYYRNGTHQKGVNWERKDLRWREQINSPYLSSSNKTKQKTPEEMKKIPQDNGKMSSSQMTAVYQVQRETRPDWSQKALERLREDKIGTKLLIFLLTYLIELSGSLNMYMCVSLEKTKNVFFKILPAPFQVSLRVPTRLQRLYGDVCKCLTGPLLGR